MAKIKDELKDQRKGEEENVLPFHPLATAPTPPGDDWLRRLPHEARFVAKPKAYQGPWLHQFGIAAILPECILLAIFEEGRLDMKWVDSRIFSQQYVKVADVPLQEVLDKPDGEQDG